MRLHPRTRIVAEAERELAEALDVIWEKHNLTTLEALIITQQFGPRLTRYLLRRERHGDNPGEKGADEA